MKYIIIIGVLFVTCQLSAAATIPAPAGYAGAWPPTWVGVTKGSDVTVDEPNPTVGDASHDFDYGKDAKGYWANIEVTGPTGVVVVEMRYIDVTDAAYGSPDYGNGAIAAAFIMGAPEDEQGSRDHEKPQYEVPLAKINGNRALWVAANECSQELWTAVTGTALDATNQAFFSAGEEDTRAVDSQTITTVNKFCGDLSVDIGKTVELPTEIEWEFLCRAGTATAFNTGRLLEGFTGFDSTELKVTSSNTMYNYDRVAMDAGVLDVPNGDATTPPWYMPVGSIDGDGFASWKNWELQAQCCGELTITGGSVIALNIIAHFDNRFQHRYVVDHYGSHTPLLMVYYFDGTNYFPRPFGDVTDASMYYRFLDDKERYVQCVAVEAVLDQNHAHSNPSQHDPGTTFDFQDPALSGDWFNDGGTWHQLEYREMIRIRVRYTANVGSPDARNVNMSEWDEVFNGSHILVTDSEGNKRMHEIRSRYTPYRFYATGTEAVQTLPIAATPVDIEAQAKAVVPDNQAGRNAPNNDMTTDDYLFNYKDALDKYYAQSNPGPKFDPGFWVPRTESEKANINPADIVQFHGFVGGGGYSDEFIVNGGAGVTSTVSANERNAWGLLHTHGNVEEWTATTWDGTSDPKNHVAGGLQVTRGGSWRTGSDRCRSAARTARNPAVGYDDVGFRFIIRN